jgi:hypothetical protein
LRGHDELLNIKDVFWLVGNSSKNETGKEEERMRKSNM